MKLITCYKVVQEDQDISVKSDRTLDLSKAELKISQFDLNAVEAGVELAATVGDSTVTALSVGGKAALENVKVRKDILSRGPDDLALVIDDKFAQSLPDVTAKAIAAAAKKVGFDLMIFGDGSSDLYAQQVGSLTGSLLKVPCINAVSKIVSADASKVVVERTLEDEVEVLELPLPAVISVTGDINVPRIPAMKAILAAAKKPVSVLALADIGYADAAALVGTESVLAPEQTERKKVIIEGDGDEQIAELANNLRKVLN